jgi:Zn-dependent peptidase ImmA (M78 family)
MKTTSAHDEKIQVAVKKARNLLGIQGFPGDFFDFVMKNDCFSEHNIILFMEDIDEVSGFIGYGDDIVAICINYNRPIGHQNFTLAHELGHWIMHTGKNTSDNDGNIDSARSMMEREASDFAGELLYPNDYTTIDFDYAQKNELFLKKNRKQLADYINYLAHKYGVSFEFALSRLLYKKGQAGRRNAIKAEIESAIGGHISDCYEKTYYRVDNSSPRYKRRTAPYDNLRYKINDLLASHKIGNATAEAILYRYDQDLG